MTNKRRMNDEYNHAHWKIFDDVKLYLEILLKGSPLDNSFRVCLDGGFRRGRDVIVYSHFLNYGHYKMIFRKFN